MSSPLVSDNLFDEPQSDTTRDVRSVADQVTLAALQDGLQQINDGDFNPSELHQPGIAVPQINRVDLSQAELLINSSGTDSIFGHDHQAQGSIAGSSGPAGTSLLSPELEPGSLLRARSGNSEPSSDEILEYTERHNLQDFFAHMFSYVARHMPLEPLAFVVEHIGTIVQRYRTKQRKRLPSLSSEDCVPFPLAPTSEPPPEMSAEQQERVVKHLTTVLRSPAISRAAAIKIFKQFAGGAQQLSRDVFRMLLRHLEATWGFTEDDVKLIVEVLKRWRFRSNAANGKRGLPLWPLAFDDFVSSYPNLLRAVRDRYMPIGANLNRSLFIRQAFHIHGEFGPFVKMPSALQFLIMTDISFPRTILWNAFGVFGSLRSIS